MNTLQKTEAGKRVLVLGASDREERYAYKAFTLLKENGYCVVPVHPRLKTIEGVPVFPDLAAVAQEGSIDTITLYVNGDTVLENAAGIISLNPRRVIMNPGTENAAAARRFGEHGIEVLEACTLVLLKTGQF